MNLSDESYTNWWNSIGEEKMVYTIDTIIKSDLKSGDVFDICLRLEGMFFNFLISQTTYMWATFNDE